MGTFKVRRGLAASRPALALGELGLDTDQGRVWVGNSGNVEVGAKVNPLLRTAVSWQVMDDDDAASTGHAVYVTVEDSPFPSIGRLLADHGEGYGQGWEDQGAAVQVIVRDEGYPGDMGVAVYCDEDATPPLKHSLTHLAASIYVPTSDGRLIEIGYDASASSNGVQVYFDDNPSGWEEAMLFVSPTHTDCILSTHAKKAWLAEVE